MVLRFIGATIFSMAMAAYLELRYRNPQEQQLHADLHGERIKNWVSGKPTT